MIEFDIWWNSAAADSFRAKHEDMDGEQFRPVWDAAVRASQAPAPAHELSEPVARVSKGPVAFFVKFAEWAKGDKLVGHIDLFTADQMRTAIAAAKAHAPAVGDTPEPSAQDLVDNMCRLSVWWTHNRSKFTTPRQAAFAAWNEGFRASELKTLIEAIRQWRASDADDNEACVRMWHTVQPIVEAAPGSHVPVQGNGKS